MRWGTAYICSYLECCSAPINSRAPDTLNVFYLRTCGSMRSCDTNRCHERSTWNLDASPSWGCRPGGKQPHFVVACSASDSNGLDVRWLGTGRCKLQYAGTLQLQLYGKTSRLSSSEWSALSSVPYSTLHRLSLTGILRRPQAGGHQEMSLYDLILYPRVFANRETVAS